MVVLHARLVSRRVRAHWCHLTRCPQIIPPPPGFCHSLMSSVKTKQLHVVENSTAQILSGKRQTGQKSLVNLEENRLLSPLQFHSLSALALISQLVGSQETPTEPRTARGAAAVWNGGNVVCANCSLPWSGFRMAAALRLCVWQHKGQQNWKASQQVERQKQRSANTAPHGLTNLWEENCSVHWISTLRGQVGSQEVFIDSPEQLRTPRESLLSLNFIRVYA